MHRLDSFNYMVRWCHAPYFSRDSTACSLQIHSSLINPHRQAFKLVFFQMTVSAERRLYAQLCYVAFIEQCRHQWPQLFSQRDKKEPLDQKKRQALRNRIAYVHDQILYIFLRFKAEVSQSLFDRIVKISNKNYNTRKCWIMVIKLLQNQ